MKFEPKYFEENVNVPPQNHVTEFIRLSLYLFGIIVALYLALGFVAQKLAERLPVRIEESLGKAFTAKLNKESYPRTQTYVQTIVDRLVAADATLPPYTYTVLIVENDMINALALPAGRIVLFTGLLEYLKTENTLAMVLSHELGHYADHDHLHGIGRGLVLMTLTSTLNILGGGVPGFIVPSIQTFELKFSREQEAKADAYGLDLVHTVYGHVGGTLDIFEVFEQEEKKVKRPGFFSTHPDSIWRKNTLKSRIQLQKYHEDAPVVIPEPGKIPFPNDRQEETEETTPHTCKLKP